LIGVEVGGWHYAVGNWAWDVPVPATVPFDLKYMGWPVVILRVVVGVGLIISWREIMKPTLLKFLPHLFRTIDQYGFILPRKFFMPASEYKKIPSRLKVDNVMPSVSDLPSLLTSIRHAGRGRAVSVGPQSAADAYETLAYREKRRRDSLTHSSHEMESGNSRPSSSHASAPSKDYFSGYSMTATKDGAVSSSISDSIAAAASNNLPTPAQSRVGSYEQMMGAGHVLLTPALSESGETGHSKNEEDLDIIIGSQNEMEEREMFSRLEKPRVRYDVEVVTKLVVYTGIAWLAVEINPIIFEIIGLGMGTFTR